MKNSRYILICKKYSGRFVATISTKVLNFAYYQLVASKKLF